MLDVRFVRDLMVIVIDRLPSAGFVLYNRRALEVMAQWRDTDADAAAAAGGGEGGEGGADSGTPVPASDSTFYSCFVDCIRLVSRFLATDYEFDSAYDSDYYLDS